MNMWNRQLVDIDNDQLRITVEPDRGGSILQVTTVKSGRNILHLQTNAPRTPAGETVVDLDGWIDQYAGGWQTVAPNGGTACTVNGARYGWHGEASVSPWNVLSVGEQSIVLERTLTSLPLQLIKQIELIGSAVHVVETAQNLDEESVDFMWSQHPALKAVQASTYPCLQTNASHWVADSPQDVVGMPIAGASNGSWLALSGRPDATLAINGGWAGLVYLDDFSDHVAWASLGWPDASLTACLVWDANIMPFMWLWIETGGTAGYPWRSDAHIVGLEPATTIPAAGLAEVPREALFHLNGKAAATTKYTLHVCERSGAISSARHEGVEFLD